METLYYYVLKIIAVITISWFAFRLSFPPFHRQLQKLYHNFNEMGDWITPLEWRKTVISLVVFLVFILAGAIIARGETTKNKGDAANVRIELRKLLDSQLMIRETSENRGVEVDQFLKAVGITPPASWCGAYVAYDLNYFGIKNPNSGWSPAYDNPRDVIWTPKRAGIKLFLGDVFTEYYASLGRVGHVGFYLWQDRDGFFVIQAGNTSGNGSRNGDRVGRKKINREKIHAIARFIK
jgi:hypothetical protein